MGQSAAFPGQLLDSSIRSKTGFRRTHVVLQRIAQRWSDYVRSRRAAPPTIVGVYGQPRGGTNFIAAALHYHPRLFAVNEHVFDYRVPLYSFWRRGSVFRADGCQDKQLDQISAVVFNKMQEFFPELWNPRNQFPGASRFVFYLRNPVRVHLSREAYREKHKPGRVEWSDTRQNFSSLLTETQEILEARKILQERHPCCLLTHEYFCCQHDRALPDLHAFLNLEPHPPANAREFLKHCGRCSRPLTVERLEGRDWLLCPKHRKPVSGAGRFNPLTPIDRKGVLDASWKSAPNIDQMMADVRRMLGATLADYFWNGDYARNLFAEHSISKAA
jgi:hypothetical protein